MAQKRKTRPITWILLVVLVGVLIIGVIYLRSDFQRNYDIASTTLNNQALTLMATQRP